MLAVSATLGMLLALTRRRPDVARLKKPPLLSDVVGMQASGTVQK
jgi:cell division protein FtsW